MAERVWHSPAPVSTSTNFKKKYDTVTKTARQGAHMVLVTKYAEKLKVHPGLARNEDVIVLV